MATRTKRIKKRLRITKDPILRIGIYSLLVNLGLAGTKLGISINTGSLALRADAIHSFVDVFGSIAIIAGLIISNRKSKNFPYGMYKIENVVAVIISLFLFIAAYEIVREAIISETTTIPYSSWVLGIIGALILVPFFFGRYEVSRGKKFNSPSLIADGSQFKADVLSSLIVFFALIGQRYGLPLDRIAAGIIAGFIVRAAVPILTSSMRVLLDASVDQDTLERIHSVITEEPETSTVDNVTGRNSGRYIFVEAIVKLRISDLKRVQQVNQRIEDKIRETVPNVDRVLIHYEPRSKTHFRYAISLANSQGEISEHFGESPYFALVDMDIQDKIVERREIVTNPHLNLAKGRGIGVAKFLLGHKPDIIIAKEDLSGKGPGYAFAEAGVITVPTKANTLDELIEHLKVEADGTK